MSLMSAAFAATFIGRIDGVPDDVHAFHLNGKIWTGLIFWALVRWDSSTVNLFFNL